jgi:predicted ATPase
MRIRRIALKNWMNFRQVDVPFGQRAFLVGPNASGKSNFLDAIRFLRDVARPMGGLQGAVKAREGLGQIRCLHARQDSVVSIEVEIQLGREEDPAWRYRLDVGQRRSDIPRVLCEQVFHGATNLLKRPGPADEGDPDRLGQTALEQVAANKEFRVVAEFLGQIRYLHLVPQIVRHPDHGRIKEQDPYGNDFLRQIADLQRTRRSTFAARKRRVLAGLKAVVPQIQDLALEMDGDGVPHLKGLYKHWRKDAGWQTEKQFSDGTLRLIGLLWILQDGEEPLLLEEPELSLHKGVVRVLPSLFSRAGKESGRQVFVSTHSQDLLDDEGIGPEEVYLLTPTENGTRVEPASRIPDVRSLLESGLPLREVVMPRVASINPAQLYLFDE